MSRERYLFGYHAGGRVLPGYQVNDGLYRLNPDAVPSLTWLLTEISAGDVIGVLDAARGERLPDDTAMTLKGLVDDQPVWASGVTYKRSEEARERESANSTIYTRVYHATRPEVFWKAIGTDIVSNGDLAGIRADATWSVPEPELTVVFNADAETIGFVIGNDMSSRDIEGDNPLYLPQAKTYDDSCVLGDRIWLQPNAQDWRGIEIQLEIERGGSIVFSGETHTDQLKRTLPELAHYLFRCKRFNRGVFFMTGTGIVPPDEFSLVAGDVIRITMPPVGTLENTVHVVGSTGDQ